MHWAQLLAQGLVEKMCLRLAGRCQVLQSGRQRE